MKYYCQATDLKLVKTPTYSCRHVLSAPIILCTALAEPVACQVPASAWNPTYKHSIH